jgi:N-acetylmuramoyl-L-alanine amidase
MNENFKGFKPVLDNGHGGLINDIYQTAGKQFQHLGKDAFYEGVYNRQMVELIVQRLKQKNVPFHILVPEDRDIMLEARCERFDRIWTKERNTYLSSIHGNAAPVHGTGIGIEGWTTKGKTNADPICDYILKQIATGFQEVTPMRFDFSDGDRDKEKDYTLLAMTKGPAMIFELGFYDNIKDYAFMTENISMRKLAYIIADAMAYIYFYGI